MDNRKSPEGRGFFRRSNTPEIAILQAVVISKDDDVFLIRWKVMYQSVQRILMSCVGLPVRFEKDTPLRIHIFMHRDFADFFFLDIKARSSVRTRKSRSHICYHFDKSVIMSYQGFG